ncbi:MAG: bacteriocin family protein, partial [Tissierellales bacterium]
MFNRHLAPISNESWKEIEERLMEVFKNYLSARKVVKVVGPKGLDYT